MTQVVKRLLSTFDSASTQVWTYSDLENALIGNEGVDGYQDVKEIILEADANGICQNAVENYVRTLKIAHGNLPCELDRLGIKYKV